MTKALTQLVAVNIEVLGQMSDLLTSLSSDRYRQSNDSDGSIGQHTRHIIEFYECFSEGYKNGVVNYDSRRRNPLIETDPTVATNELQHVIHALGNITGESQFTVLAESFGEDLIEVPSSVSREVLYLLEHTIHHMAIIRLLVKSCCLDHDLPKEFGVAYSTLRYREESAN